MSRQEGNRDVSKRGLAPWMLVSGREQRDKDGGGRSETREDARNDSGYQAMCGELNQGRRGRVL